MHLPLPAVVQSPLVKAHKRLVLDLNGLIHRFRVFNEKGLDRFSGGAPFRQPRDLPSMDGRLIDTETIAEYGL